MSNKADGFSKDYNLETVTSFKYLGAIVTDEGSKREELARTEQTTSVLTKLKTVWKDRNITSKHRIKILHKHLSHQPSSMHVKHGPSQLNWNEGSKSLN